MNYVRHLERPLKPPQFIETIRGRGYRFRAPVTALIPETQLAPPRPRSQSNTLVERAAELKQLHQRVARVLDGDRQVIFITGEPGIGKTTLVDAFVKQLSDQPQLWVGHGQCIDQFQTGEAYLPLLEALTRMGQGADGQELVELLWQHGPSWLLQMPSLVPIADREALQRLSMGATRERLLRKLAEVIERLTAGRPLLLVLEDLHWADPATLDWLSYAARRRDPPRLFILGTYRPVDATVGAHPIHPVAQELLRQDHCTDLRLAYWSDKAIGTYLQQRFGGFQPNREWTQALRRRTNGNPLFTVKVIDELVYQGALEESADGWTLRGGIETVATPVPESLRQLIDHQLSHLSVTEQALLEAASLVGIVFSVASVAAGTGQDGRGCRSDLALWYLPE